ncbi:hypothetical protein C464_08165 [Halorubrum coriense DSM 10284]|uniref:Uncharacterized protein n=1 Tax=Halorubrum coriense DSM 10284 TaxID=1227466 RepID=M0EJC1_9EURY|nr:hypothetical protein [Halorubrum coriense]ELZ47881.1 hypothetical protein C464_08165 [Halorubrum coriense DSM 10284]
MKNPNSDVETGELPQIIDDDGRGHLDVAADIVDEALELAGDAGPTSAARWVAIAVERMSLDVDDRTWDLAVNTTMLALREGDGEANA